MGKLADQSALIGVLNALFDIGIQFFRSNIWKQGDAILASSIERYW